MKQFYIDVETTGTNPKECALIQIGGIIVIDGEEMEQVNLFGSPIKGQYVSEDALKVNGRTVEEIKRFPSATTMYSQMVGAMSKYVDKFNPKDKFHLIGWNVDFDYQMLLNWYEKLGDKYFGSWFFNPSLDVAKIAGWYLQEERSQLQNFKLETVARYLDIEVKETHDALADILLTRQVLNKVIKLNDQRVLDKYSKGDATT